MEEFDPITAWPALVRAYQQIRSESEAVLKKHGVSSLEEYDVLLELRRAIEPLTLSAIEDLTLMRQYQLSRMVDRLMRRGLVHRSVAGNDARERHVTLTKEGREVQKRAGKAYLKVLKQRISERVGVDDLRQMTSQLKMIADS